MFFTHEKLVYSTHSRNFLIDILRGLCMWWVILLHLNIRMNFKTSHLGSIMPSVIFNFFFLKGYYGVCVFFVISGFLITKSTINKWGSLHNMNVKFFYILRFARIMPLLLTLLLVLTCFHIADINSFVINPEQTSLGYALFAAITFHINFLEIFTGYLPPAWDVLWSLSIEETFYLFFPLLFFVFKSEKKVFAFLSIFFVISPIARVWWFYENELADKNSFAYIDAITLGVLTAFISKNSSLTKFQSRIILVLGILIFYVVLLHGKILYDFGLTKIGLNVTVLAIGTSLLLFSFNRLNCIPNRLLYVVLKPFQMLGEYSYEIYLTHSFVVIFVSYSYYKLQLSPSFLYLTFSMAIIFSIIVGKLIATYLTNPANKFLRQKLIK